MGTYIPVPGSHGSISEISKGQLNLFCWQNARSWLIRKARFWRLRFWVGLGRVFEHLVAPAWMGENTRKLWKCHEFDGFFHMWSCEFQQTLAQNDGNSLGFLWRLWPGHVAGPRWIFLSRQPRLLPTWFRYLFCAVWESYRNFKQESDSLVSEGKASKTIKSNIYAAAQG